VHINFQNIGLSHTNPGHARSAYLAAAATDHCVMLKGHEAFRPFNGPSAGETRPQWEALHNGADGLLKPELRSACPNDLKVLTAISEAQGVYWATTRPRPASMPLSHPTTPAPSTERTLAPAS
jgi:hypothetical protein